MHSVLASDSTDPGFGPEEPSAESLGLLTATVDEEIERVFLELPRRRRGARADRRPRRGGARAAAACCSHFGTVGRVIRHHGDFHLGQTLWCERRLGDHRLRGRAGPLAHRAAPQALAAPRRRRDAPLVRVRRARRSRSSRGVRRARRLGGAGARASSSTATSRRSTRASLPPGRTAIDRLISIFELEKAVYELRYELNNRPDWVRIPVAGILRMLERRRGVAR